MTTTDEQAVRGRLRTVAVERLADLVVPGGGHTAERHAALTELARTCPVDVARLAEAHADALAILAEAGCDPVGESLYGVWASSSAGAGVRVDLDPPTLTGTKPFCSGLRIVDRALITAEDPQGRQLLVDIDVTAAPSLEMTCEGWASPALQDTNTGMVHFDRHPVIPDRVIGGPGFYVDRPGFWHGAMGPAACWAGGAIGLVDRAEDVTGTNPHRLAHLGAMRSAVWTMRAVLAQAGDEIDRNPADSVAAEYRARSARHMIERLCSAVLDRFGQSLGPRPFVGDAAVPQRYADVHLYLRQHHGERDLQHLGELPQALPPL